jgi:hydroxymethylpyrimidine pyrophosphatase-like HAD family hydrolase
MDIIFFDLDGTLLNKSSKLSTFTKEVLLSLNENGIANTVATGRTLISARQVLDGHPFSHTQIYSV